MGCCCYNNDILRTFIKTASREIEDSLDRPTLFVQVETQAQRKMAMKIWLYSFLKHIQSFIKEETQGSQQKQIIKIKHQLQQVLVKLAKGLPVNEKTRKYVSKLHRLQQPSHQKSSKTNIYISNKNSNGLQQKLIDDHERQDYKRKQSNEGRQKRVSNATMKSQVNQHSSMVQANTPYSLPMGALQIDQDIQPSSSLKTEHGQLMDQASYQKLREMELKTIINSNSIDRQSKKIESIHSQLNSKEQQTKISTKAIHENQALKKQLQLASNQINKLKISISSLQASMKNVLNEKAQISQQHKNVSAKLKDSQKKLKQNELARSFIYKQAILSVKREKKLQNIAEKNQENIHGSNGSNRGNEWDYQIIFNLFPNSKILPDHEKFQNAIGIRTLISQLFTQKVKKTTKIYQFDDITLTHFDKYIQNKENILILISLKNQYIIGAFAGKFQANDELSQSFLFSIPPSKQPMKATTNIKIKRINLQNSSYLNFGNGELRLKAKTLDLSCNVGSFNSIYSWDKKGITFDKFFGGQKRSCSVRTYQIHQITFFGQVKQTEIN